MVGHAVGASPTQRPNASLPLRKHTSPCYLDDRASHAHYGLAGIRPTYGLPSPLALHSDTAVIGPKGLRRHLGLLNPRINPRQEKHELVLDVDDLVVSVVPDNGTGIIPLGHVATGIVLGAGIGLSGWFALGASIKEVGDATRILRRLRAEKKRIHATLPDVHQGYPWRVKKERLKKAMLLENNTAKWEQRIRALFSGGLVTTSAIAEIYGYLSNPFLFGGLSPALAASSVIALSIAAPMISVFAGANALLQFHRVFRECRNKPLVKEVAHHNPWRQEAFDARKFIEGRRKQVRNHAMVTGVAFLGIAVGVPVTFFSGGYGLAMLVPGIITIAVANQYESRKIEHIYPMTLDEIQHLALARHIVNDMGLAYQEYRLFKDIKCAKRSDYLAGAHLGPISRVSLAPVRLVQRCMGRARHNRESSQYTLYRFFGARLSLLGKHMQHKIEGYQKHYHEADDEIQHLLDQSDLALADIRQDHAAWLGEWNNYDTLTPRVTLSRLCNLLVDYEVFRDFALRVVQDKHLGPRLTDASGTITLTPKRLISRVERAGSDADALTQRLFCLAEVLILMVIKARRHSRARELADLAIDRKRAKRKLDKVHGAIVPVPD